MGLGLIVLKALTTSILRMHAHVLGLSKCSLRDGSIEQCIDTDMQIGVYRLVFQDQDI